jgi:hypothetical protein
MCSTEETLMIDRPMASRIVNLMNEALRADPAAVSGLCSVRVACNEQLAEHPTIQCSWGEPATVGLLGILNGLGGADADGRGAVAAIVEDGQILRFELLERRRLRKRAVIDTTRISEAAQRAQIVSVNRALPQYRVIVSRAHSLAIPPMMSTDLAVIRIGSDHEHLLLPDLR